MSDPYKVLNIAPTASDEEVKHAYREMARKYHPDNYHDNPLADLAQEKMKEINEAYEQIQKQRKSGSSYSAHRESGGGARTYASGGSSELLEVRAAISRGDISQAERILNMLSDHGAEWNFLMGVVCSRRGWLDEAKRYFEVACRMDPVNEEYRNALNMFVQSGYHPEGYRSMRTMGVDNDMCMRLCAAGSCCVLSGGRCCIC
ncbi:MAG: molecular chaperone DnaJ [Ruminococcaceae bacterium]|jgi:curved DNA-binding protein CbpA|nr:molecular chaperone DnaJ [Oscillospiraceae bacterium]